MMLETSKKSRITVQAGVKSILCSIWFRFNNQAIRCDGESVDTLNLPHVQISKFFFFLFFCFNQSSFDSQTFL